MPKLLSRHASLTSEEVGLMLMRPHGQYSARRIEAFREYWPEHFPKWKAIRDRMLSKIADGLTPASAQRCVWDEDAKT